jgi:ADP-ribose pyrophosphatase
MKIPDSAKLVFKGVMFDTYQWEQEMFDGSFETFEMLKRPDTVQIITTNGDKVIIAEESQPTKKNFLTLLGGRVDHGEDALTAAKRELMEEAGIESDSWELLRVEEPYHKMDWRIHLFIAKNCQVTGQPKLDSGEKIEIISLGFDEFVATATSDRFCGREIKSELLYRKIDGTLDELKNKIF